MDRQSTTATVRNWLSLEPDQCASFHQIVRWTGSPRAAVQTLGHLIRRGLVERIYRPGDRPDELTLWDPPHGENRYHLTDPSLPPLQWTAASLDRLDALVAHHFQLLGPRG